MTPYRTCSHSRVRTIVAGACAPMLGACGGSHADAGPGQSAQPVQLAAAKPAPLPLAKGADGGKPTAAMDAFLE